MREKLLAPTLILTLASGSVTSLAQTQPPRRVGIAAALQSSYAAIKRDLLASAEKMSEADYALKPGTMEQARTFGQLFAHVAAGQSGTCAAVKSVPNPLQGRKIEAELKGKAEIVKVLADSFAFCDDVFGSTTDANALEFIRQGPYELTRATVLYGVLAHNAEMYGISTVYLRLKGLVPPASDK